VTCGLPVIVKVMSVETVMVDSRVSVLTTVVRVL
jgi:hypothetical protein